MGITLPTVLGIDPRARQIGLAVLCGEELLFYAVKTFRRKTFKDSLDTLREIIKKLIVEYGVESIAMEKIVFLQQHRSFVKIAADDIKNFIKAENILFYEYNPKQIRLSICGLEKPTNQNTALILSQRYSELVRYFNVPRLWQKRYYALLFGAIAVGLVCAKELSDNRQNSIK
jgi:Holliday junction resolvasome RuvABC endonuclease subunit